MTQDDDLRDRFQRARAAERSDTPSFGRVLAGRSRVAPRSRGRLVALAAAVSVALAAIVISQRREQGAERADLIPIGIGSLHVPSDFLLDVLGAETLRSVPGIGRTDDWFPSLSGMKGARP